MVDEVWDDARIESFLDKSPLGDERSADFSALLYAYRSMRSDDFERFVAAFQRANRDLDARGNDGRTVLAIVSGHRQGAEFARILRAAGATD